MIHIHGNPVLRTLLALLVTGTLLMTSACSVKPRANVGLDVDYYGGGFHVHPSAHVGLTGRPR